MIFFTPPTLVELERTCTRQRVLDYLALLDACKQNGQMLYAPPGSDLARGILSRSPLATYLFLAAYGVRGTRFYQLDSQLQKNLIANCFLRTAREVTFQEEQMKVLLAIPNGEAPVQATLSFSQPAIQRLCRHFSQQGSRLTNNCFGGAIAQDALSEVLNAFPTWQEQDLVIEIPDVPDNKRKPYTFLLNLILCCEVGYCPVRLFQLLGMSASDVLDALTPQQSPQVAELRTHLTRNFANIFAPPPAGANAERPYATYADLPHFLDQYRVAQSDLAAALHIEFPVSPELFLTPLPQEARELLTYAQVHNHAELRQELLRRAGDEYACDLWTAQDLCAFRAKYCFTEALLKDLFPSEPINLAQWERGEADIPFSVCKGLDNLQRVFTLLYPVATALA